MRSIRDIILTAMAATAIAACGGAPAADDTTPAAEVPAATAEGEGAMHEGEGAMHEGHGAMHESEGAMHEGHGAMHAEHHADEQPLANLQAPGEAQVGDNTTCPVSGKQFTVTADSPSVEHDGKTYYFCCPGCNKKFAADPAKFLAN